MDRRSFVGSVLGLFVGSQIPFKIEEAKVIVGISPKLQVLKNYVKIFESTKTKLYKYRLYIITPDGFKLWAPSIKKIDRDVEELKCTFLAHSIKITQPINYVAGGLVDDQNSVIREFTLSSTITAIVRDTLNVTYTLSAGW